jgi:hypothetical protein
VLIKAVKAKEYTKTHEELILKSFRGLLGQGVEINFIYLSEIPREPSGKYKWVHSKLNMFNENS